jgi:hypothetical protein
MKMNRRSQPKQKRKKSVEDQRGLKMKKKIQTKTNFDLEDDEMGRGC